jgi:hypothetical protein
MSFGIDSMPEDALGGLIGKAALRDAALDVVAVVFKEDAELRENCEMGIEALRAAVPWASDKQAADIMRYVMYNFEAVKRAAEDGLGLEEVLRRAIDNVTYAAAYADAKAAKKL